MKKKEKLAKMVKHNKAYSKYFQFLLEHGEGDIFKENKDTRDFVSKRYWTVSKSKSRIRMQGYCNTSRMFIIFVFATTFLNFISLSTALIDEEIDNLNVAPKGKENEVERSFVSSGISITFASYGGNCNGYDQTATLGAECNGKSICKYRIDHTTIGDPCPGVSKAYAVSYSCDNGIETFHEIVSSEASGKTIEIDCLKNKEKTVAPSVPDIIKPKIDNDEEIHESDANVHPKPVDSSETDDLDIDVGTLMTYGGKLLRKIGSNFHPIPYLDIFDFPEEETSSFSDSLNEPTIELLDDPKEDNSDAASSSGLLQLIPDAISAGMEVLIDGLKRKYANMFLSTGLVNNESPVKPIRHENAIDKVDTKYTESQVNGEPSFGDPLTLGLAAVGVAIATGVYAVSLLFSDDNAQENVSEYAKSNYEIFGAEHFMTNFDSKTSFAHLRYPKRKRSVRRWIKKS